MHQLFSARRITSRPQPCQPAPSASLMQLAEGMCAYHKEHKQWPHANHPVFGKLAGAMVRKLAAARSTESLRFGKGLLTQEVYTFLLRRGFTPPPRGASRPTTGIISIAREILSQGRELTPEQHRKLMQAYRKAGSISQATQQWFEARGIRFTEASTR